MNVVITGDTATESGIGEVIYRLNGPTRKHFKSRDYGAGLVGLGVVLMCQNPALNLKRRVRLSKKDKILYMDIMLDLPTMRAVTPVERYREVAQRLYGEVPEIFARYKIKDFNQQLFLDEFCAWIDGLA